MTKAVKQRNLTKEQVRELVNIASLAAMQGNKAALKVMDEVQEILTTDWQDVPQNLKEQWALVAMHMIAE